jgi:hypothetical protein
VLADLEAQGYSRREMSIGLAWVVRNKEHLGGKIYSLGLLPEVIGQALGAGENETAPKKDESRQKQAQPQPSEPGQLHVLEDLYLALSTSEQGALREKAVESLLQQGVKQEFLLEGLVKSEIYRLLHLPPRL